MELPEKNSLLTESANVLLATRDFGDLAKKSVELVVRELPKQNLAGAGVFRLYEHNGLLQACAYATRRQRLAEKLLTNKKFAEMNISISETDNLLVKTVVSNQVQYSNRAADFSRGAIPDSLADRFQDFVGVKLAVGLPIPTDSGKAAGAILVGLDKDGISGQELSLFETFAKQLGLAFSNIFEFERLAAKYQKSVERNSLNTLEKDTVPNLKFTLRLTTRQSESLKRLAREQGKTQAEVIRQWLDTQ